MPDLNITCEPRGDGLTFLTAEGFLDAHTFEKMEKTINALFDEGKYKLVVGLEKLDYISSAGAGVFIGAIGVAQENNGNLVLLNPTPNVKEVFDLLGLTQIFPIVGSEAEATAFFG
ncbi:MAG: STAS domain-containing protein [Planctomycetes bacterium]|nr:STAS domain-containing protein [Planctomycetota bacterium]